MKRNVTSLLALVMLATLACAGCKKTAEGETSNWATNKAALKKFSEKYSNLSKVIDQHLEETQKKFDKAKKLSDVDKQVKAMAAANEAARKVISPLESYEAAVRETRTLIKDKKIGKLAADRVNPAIKACKKAKKKAYKKLTESEVEDVDALIARVTSASSTVKTGMSKLKALKREVDKEKKKEKKKDKKDKKDKDKSK